MLKDTKQNVISQQMTSEILWH